MPETPQILRPNPRRTFDITPASNENSIPPSPSPENTNPELLEAKLHGASPPSRTRSILNLTSSTLLGIYSPTGYEVSREEPSTPWGTGALTPNRKDSADGYRASSMAVEWDDALSRTSFDRQKAGFSGVYLPFLLKVTLLFVIGIAYGSLITHLHDNQKLAPVHIEAFDRHSWNYLIFWGLTGVTLGSLQPWVDFMWPQSTASSELPGSTAQRRRSSFSADGDEGAQPSDSGADWTPVVRSIGAFVGVAFAIRKLPWQSTLQISLTLALVNPVLWYLIDRSKPGFILSAVVGIAGTFALLGTNPNILPSPAILPHTVAFANISGHEPGVTGLISEESIGIWTWIASVLFCSCVCFGNIGRRLALGQQSAFN